MSQFPKLFFCVVFFIVMVFSAQVFGLTYFRILVEGVESSTQIQGQDQVFELDTDGSGLVESYFYMDADSNGVIDAGEYPVFQFDFIDNSDELPPDLDPTEGVISMFFPIHMLPFHYVILAHDETDTIMIPYSVYVPDPLDYSVTGQVILEGVTAPNPLLAGIALIGGTFDPPLMMYAATFDETGTFSFNWPGDPGMLSVMILRAPEGYVPAEFYMVDVDGHETGVEIEIPMEVITNGYVYGDIKDAEGNLIIRDVHIFLVNQTTAERTEFVASGGSYFFSDVEPDNYKIDVTTADLIPDYLTELYWDDPYFSFTVESGDSIRKDQTCYEADTIITGYITMDGGPISETFYFFCFSFEMGYTKTLCEEDGDFTLNVAVGDGSPYRIRVGTEITPIPDGYVVEGTNYQWDNPVGSYVNFNLISDWGTINGTMDIDPDYPSPPSGEWYMHRLCIYDASDSTMVAHITHNYGLDWSANLEPGSYYGIMVNRPYNPECEYLTYPAGFDDLTIASGSTTDMEFSNNYRQCDCFVHLTGVPTDSITDSRVIAEGDGSFPDCYYINEEFSAGTTDIDFKICDANWTFYAPEIPWYEASPAETTINVPETQTLLHVTFNYTATGIREPGKIKNFELSRAFPNPFNAATRIEYNIPDNGPVYLNIYDIKGKLVRTLNNGIKAKGSHVSTWDGTTEDNDICGSGIYFAKLQFGNNTSVIRLLLMK